MCLGGFAATITLEWEVLDNDSVKLFRTAWRSAVPRKREVSVYPDALNKPEEFFQARWVSNFAFRHTGPSFAAGQTGSAIFQELPTKIFAN